MPDEPARNIESAMAALHINANETPAAPNPLASVQAARGIRPPVQIPPDVQERIRAFQMARQNRTQMTSRSTTIPQEPQQQQQQQQQQPQQLSSQLSADPEKQLQLQQLQQAQQQQKLQPKSLTGQQSSPITRPQPKLSLSQRRGLALNGASGNRPSMKLPSDDPSSSPAPQALHVDANPQSLMNSFSQYIDVASGTLKFAGKASLDAHGINFSSGSSFKISLDELEILEEIGRGNYGTVSKVRHRPTNVIMAMKEIRLELDDSKFRQIVMELDVLHKCISPFIVDFYGAFFVEGAVYICMEYMDGGSLDRLYSGGVEEPVLAKITEAVVRGLKILKDDHNIIHRDIKPTNILASSSGAVKLIDFGVSGNLVASIARTNIGCQSYMAPERIKSASPTDAITYTVQSDIWSLGLTLLEIANGSYPYPPETYGNVFSQLSAIVDGEPPALPEPRFSHEAASFVKQCLNKDAVLRPTYGKLLAHPWLVKYRNVEVDMAGWVKSALATRAKGSNINAVRPALHAGGAVAL